MSKNIQILVLIFAAAFLPVSLKLISSMEDGIPYLEQFKFMKWSYIATMMAWPFCVISIFFFRAVDISLYDYGILKWPLKALWMITIVTWLAMRPLSIIIFPIMAFYSLAGIGLGGMDLYESALIPFTTILTGVFFTARFIPE